MPPRPGYATVTPYLVCKDADAAIRWYTRHLGAIERYRLNMDGDKIAHAELEVGDSVIMLADEFPEMNIVGPETLGGSTVSLNVYVDDVDTVFAAMLTDGATELQPVSDQFHGDRAGKLGDPFGHIWHIGTNVENPDPDEIRKRFAEMMKGGGQ